MIGAVSVTSRPAGLRSDPSLSGGREKMGADGATVCAAEAIGQTATIDVRTAVAGVLSKNDRTA